MKKLTINGAINALLIPLILAVMFFFASLGFGLWAFAGREDYKNNVDEKVATAVDVAKRQTATEKDNEFIAREKEPLKQWQGPASLGSITIKYPKTWSGYIDDAGRGTTPLNGFFQPGVVPGTSGDASYALRVQVSDRPFADEAKGFDVQVRQGRVTAQPYQPVNVRDVVGLRLDGEIERGKEGVMIMLPLRDKTIKLWTEAQQYRNDFENNILPNFSFTP